MLKFMASCRNWYMVEEQRKEKNQKPTNQIWLTFCSHVNDRQLRWEFGRGLGKVMLL